MPSTEPQHAAVTEAARIAAESSRRTVEDARTAVQLTRGLIENATEVFRGFFDAWVAGGEAIVKAAFELQNASLAAGLALFEATTTSERTVLKEWDAAVRQVQKAALETFKAQQRAAALLQEQAAPKAAR